MNLYLISQTFYIGYDVFDSAVVAADTEEEARLVNPSGSTPGYGWPEPKHVKVKLLGVALAGIGRGVVCASFNAG
jgi:hypothetical protein